MIFTFIWTFPWWKKKFKKNTASAKCHDSQRAIFKAWQIIPPLRAPSSSPESHSSNIPPFLKLGFFLFCLDYSWWRKWSLFSQVDEAEEGKRLLCLSMPPVTSSKFLLLLVMSLQQPEAFSLVPGSLSSSAAGWSWSTHSLLILFLAKNKAWLISPHKAVTGPKTLAQLTSCWRHHLTLEPST